MNKASLVSYEFGGNVAYKDKVESDDFPKRNPRKRIFVSYESTLPVDLLSHYDKWGRLEDKIETLGQENPLVRKETVKMAGKIVELLQSYESLPDVSVGPCGEIDFDWIRSKDWSLTISVCPNREVAFAGIFDIKGSQAHNEDYKLPNEVLAYLEAFDRVNNIDE